MTREEAMKQTIKNLRQWKKFNTKYARQLRKDRHLLLQELKNFEIQIRERCLENREDNV